MNDVTYKSPKLLNFISNKDLFRCVETVISKAKLANAKSEKTYKNAIDPFSAVFDSTIHNISIEEWINLEKIRQKQKTLQNAIGDFHENIIGAMPNWEKLPVGGIIDVISKKKKIIADIKNKYNTTKGSDKKTLYDNLEALINEKYKEYIGYYVEIIPQNGKKYNVAFYPPDNTSNTKRPINEKIRKIDGYSFYEIVSGEKNALQKLYMVLPEVISSILDKPEIIDLKSNQLFNEFFYQTYKDSL